MHMHKHCAQALLYSLRWLALMWQYCCVVPVPLDSDGHVLHMQLGLVGSQMQEETAVVCQRDYCMSTEGAGA